MSMMTVNMYRPARGSDILFVFIEGWGINIEIFSPAHHLRKCAPPEFALLFIDPINVPVTNSLLMDGFAPPRSFILAKDKKTTDNLLKKKKYTSLACRRQLLIFPGKNDNYLMFLPAKNEKDGCGILRNIYSMSPIVFLRWQVRGALVLS